jgi:NAD(P)-dependent dehydrogenase (short-subunit alcohol dehydrogenase family)
VGQSAFITGAASGIGRETARLFAARGWRVGLADRDLAGARALADELGQPAEALECDVTAPAQVRAALEGFTRGSGGRLDLLVNNAGILHMGPFEELPMEDYRRQIDVNVTGFTDVLHAAFPALKAARGRVVNLASASAEYGTPDFASYCATKFYVRGLTEALDVEWRRHGIRVAYVMPSFVATGMIEGRHSISMDRLGVALGPGDVAQVIWRAAHGRRLVWRVGTSFRVIRLLLAPVPVALKRRIMGWVSGYGDAKK